MSEVSDGQPLACPTCGGSSGPYYGPCPTCRAGLTDRARTSHHDRLVRVGQALDDGCTLNATFDGFTLPAETEATEEVIAGDRAGAPSR